MIDCDTPNHHDAMAGFLGYDCRMPKSPKAGAIGGWGGHGVAVPEIREKHYASIEIFPVSEVPHTRAFQRRKYVRQRLETGVPISGTEKRAIAEMFKCSHSAVYADIILFTVDFGGITRHIGAGMRKRIKARDRCVCQYCGVSHPKNSVIDHVIPFAQGGVGTEYNLVFACASCNAKKKLCAWAPNNLDSITESNHEWRAKVLAMANHSRR